MVRLLVASALVIAASQALGGCVGEDVPDYRPLELDYLSQSVFEPSCGAAQCHSTFKQSLGYVFDTPEAVRSTIVNNQLISLDPRQYDPDDATHAPLITWITQPFPFLAKDPSGAYIGRMPADAPLPNRDVELLIEWIQHRAPGAQCNPDLGGGKSCTVDSSGRQVVANCKSDWNFDLTTAVPCGSGKTCVAGMCQ